jgi:hypothetical protein
MDRLSDGTRIEWKACGCTVWPMALAGTGRCGKCGEKADYPMPKPKEGKARPLTEGEKHDRLSEM